MIPMFKQNVGMTKIYAKGIAELFLIRCNPYHWDGSGEVPDNISFDVYKRKIDETYDGCTLEIQLCKPDGCLCYAASVHLYEGGFWTGHGIGCFDKTAICNDPGSVDALTSAIMRVCMSKNHFYEQHNLEFMAYVVDHEKTYAESYEFLRLFDVTSAYTGPHSAMGEMTKTLWDYLEQKTILDPDYLNTPELQNEAYENAVKQYVLQKKDTAFEESLRKFLEHIDDTATIEFFANPTGWAERVVNVLDKNLTSHDGTPFSESIGKKFVAVQRLTQSRMLDFQSKPHCWESECRSLFAATAKAKKIRLVIEANGKEMQVQYPVSNLITFEMIKNKVISAWAIAPRKLSDEVKEFLAENCADYSKYWSDIPMKTVSRIESGRKVLWKNPCFEGDRK